MNNKKHIAKYDNNYCVLIPVYYDHETRPAWRKYYIGAKTDCENILATAPDFLRATPEENKTNRYYKRLEYNFYMDRSQVKKAAAIKKQYKLEKGGFIMTLYDIEKATTNELNSELARLEAKKARLMLPGENWILAVVEMEINDIKNELDKRGL